MPVVLRDQTIVIRDTLEAAPAYLRIYVQLQRDGQPVSGRAMGLSGLEALKGLGDLSDLEQMLGGGQDGMETSFAAFLDTGASSHVLSLSTVQRFGIAVVPDAVYHETGLHGLTPMGVTEPYALHLAASKGMMVEQAEGFRLIDPQTRLQVNRQPANPLVEMTMGEINVIGMPAIRKLVVEVDPAPLTGGLTALDEAAQGLDLGGLQGLDSLLNRLDEFGVGPAVRFHDPGHQPAAVDVVVPLTFRNFSRRQNPQDRGPLPALADNPVILNVESRMGEHRSTGDWLLDTGAPVSMISTAQAAALGLHDDAGQPTRPADFSLPLGGVGGQISEAQGYRIDVLRVPAADGVVLEYRPAWVLVADVSTELDSGEVVTLDGIFGTNLLLPTMGELGLGLPGQVSTGPFRRIWIDGPGGRLLLELAEEVGDAVEAQAP